MSTSSTSQGGTDRLRPTAITPSRRGLLRSAALGAGAVSAAGLLSACTRDSDEAPAAAGTGATVAAGKGPGVADKFKGKVIGVPVFAFADTNEPFIAAMVQQAAKEAGLDWEFIVTDCQGDQQKAQAAFDSYITRDVDMILNVIVAERLVSSQLQRAKDSDIPVVGLYSFAPPSSDATVVDYASRPEGDTVFITSYMMEDLQIRHADKSTIKVAALDSPLDIISIRQPILRGMLEKVPQIELVEEQYGIDLANTVGATTSAVEALLTKHPDLDAVWVNYPAIAMPAVAALEQKGKADQVKVYAHTATGAGLDALTAQGSALAATTWQDLVYGAYKGVENCLRVFAGEPPSKFLSWTSPVPSAVIDATTVADTVELDAGDLGKQRTWMSGGGGYRQTFIDQWSSVFAS